MSDATIVMPGDEGDAAEQLSMILAGSPPREVDGRLVFQVPIERMRSALLSDVTTGWQDRLMERRAVK